MNRRELLGMLGGAASGWTPSLLALESTPAHRGPVTSLGVRGETIYSVSQGGVFKNEKRVLVPPWRVSALALAPKGLWLAGGAVGESGRMAWLSLEEEEAELAERSIADDLIADLSRSTDGTLLAWGELGGGIGTVQAEKGWREAPLHRHEAHEGAVRTVRFAPSGSLLASGGLDGAVILQEVAKGKASEVRRLQDHTAGVESLAFSPNGRWLATGSRDSRVRVHRVSNGRLMRTYRGLGMEAEPVVGRLPACVLSLAWFETEAGTPRLMAGTSSGEIYRLSEKSSEWKKLAQLSLGPVTSLSSKPGQLVVGARAPLVALLALDE